MQAVRVDDDRWIIYDTDQRLAVLVSLSQLQEQVQRLSDEIAALFARLSRGSIQQTAPQF